MFHNLRMRLNVATMLLLVLMSVVNLLPSAYAQDSQTKRKVKLKIAPTYPEMARRMELGGTVKLMVEVAANGSVKSSKVLGGHPLLAAAAEDAVKSWKFEAGSEPRTEIVEFVFKPRS